MSGHLTTAQLEAGEDGSAGDERAVQAVTDVEEVRPAVALEIGRVGARVVAVDGEPHAAGAAVVEPPVATAGERRRTVGPLPRPGHAGLYIVDQIARSLGPSGPSGLRNLRGLRESDPVVASAGWRAR